MQAYTKIEAWKLAEIHAQIQAVEKEAGRLSTIAAAVTSGIVLWLWSRGPWFVVRSP